MRAMSAKAFTTWVENMRQTEGWTHKDCQRALGCGANQIARWMKTGAPQYIDLACMSLYMNSTNRTFSRYLE